MKTTKVARPVVHVDDKNYYISILREYCTKYEIDFSVMAAICEHESSWDPTAVRYEPNYKYIFNPFKYVHASNSLETEKNLQMCSWGLGQIMAATARSLEYNGPIVMLCDPEIGIDYACKYFKKSCDRYPSVDRKIAAYNAGSAVYENGVLKNQKYVDAVLIRVKDYRDQNP